MQDTAITNVWAAPHKETALVKWKYECLKVASGYYSENMTLRMKPREILELAKEIAEFLTSDK